jgi:hypothetical protein
MLVCDEDSLLMNFSQPNCTRCDRCDVCTGKSSDYFFNPLAYGHSILPRVTEGRSVANYEHGIASVVDPVSDSSVSHLEIDLQWQSYISWTTFISFY